MPDIIALCGPQQVGKTTAAQSMVDHFQFTRVAFADPLYDMVAALMRLPVHKVRQLPKNEPMDVFEGRTLRHALQTLGTEWGRNLVGSDIWVNAAIRRAASLNLQGIRVVIDDCRFINEYEALRTAGAKIVLLQRDELPEQINTAHGSEVEWPNFPHFDVVVKNPPDGAPHWATTASRAILGALYGG